MKKWKGKPWIKALLLAAVMVSVLGTAFGTVGLVAGSLVQETENAGENDFTKDVQLRMLGHYAAAYVDNYRSEGEKSLHAYEGSNLSCAAEKITFSVSEDKTVTCDVKELYGDAASLKKTDGVYAKFFNDDEYLDYNVSSFFYMCSSDYYSYSHGDTYVDAGYVLPDDEENGAAASIDEEESGYRLAYDNKEELKAGEYVFYRVYLLPAWEKYQSYAEAKMGTNGMGHAITLLTTHTKDLKFKSGAADFLWTPFVLEKLFIKMANIGAYLLVLSLICLLAAFVFLMTVSGHRVKDDEIHLRFVDRVPYAVYALVVMGAVPLGIFGNVGVIYLYSISALPFYGMVVLSLFLYALWMLVALAFCMSTATRIKSGRFWDYTLVAYILRPIKKLIGFTGNEIREKTPFYVRLTILLLLLFFAEFIAVASGTNGGALVGVFFLYKIVETIFIYYMAIMLNRLFEGGKRVANGDYENPINTEKMLPLLKSHGENINRVGEGISIAVEKQMKSERLKTELITNVSHDIKTPLTSIINYVDLLKKQNIADETAAEYISVLERQSSRLKKLIEDLMEASKASTGNVQVTMESCDAAVMISQIVGDYQEKMQKKGLEIIIGKTEAPTTIMADGRHLYRVFDNIMNNIYKYSQENTRVYIDIETGLHRVDIVFKNISGYPLNISSEELMERFVRGDSSRNTEGHGLGLSIAKSLVELMKGSLSIDVDGDLFKVDVTLNR